MRIIKSFAISLLLCASVSFAQAPGQAEGRFTFGRRAVVIPAPEGFVEVTSRMSGLKTRFQTIESEDLELLAVHAPIAHYEKFKDQPDMNLDFYTKVSISTEAKERDLSEANFADAISGTISALSDVTDEKNPQFKAILDDLEKKLSKVTGGDTSVSLTQPVMLGQVARERNLYCAMMIMTVRVQMGSNVINVPMVGSFGLLRLNHRLVFIYAYKKYNGKEDVTVLKDFTIKWARQIVALNKG